MKNLHTFLDKAVNGRLVLFGDVYHSKNNPVLVALELNPTDRGGKNLNVIKVANAYGKEKNLQNFINKSKILYVEPNKKRFFVNSWGNPKNEIKIFNKR